MKVEREIRDETRRIRERARGLSGFWIPELAAAAYALEWALGKRDSPPSRDIGSANSAHGRLSEALLKTAEKEATASRKSAGPKKPRRGLRRIK